MSAPLRHLACRLPRLAAATITAAVLAPGAIAATPAAARGHRQSTAAARHAAAQARCERARSGAARARGAQGAARRAAAVRLCARIESHSSHRGTSPRPSPPARRHPAGWRPVAGAPQEPGPVVRRAVGRVHAS